MNHFASLSRIKSMGVALPAIASASVSCLSSSSLLSVEKTVVTRDYWHFIVILGLSSVVVTS